VIEARPDIDLRTNFWPGSLAIQCSRSHLGKTLMNLLSNGLEAVDGAGSVRIATSRRNLSSTLDGFEEIPAGEWVVLSVSDSGGGIDEVDMARIFDPFFTKKVLGRSGTGLGLTVVWHTVHEHSGRIGVTSSGDGTEFELFFPATDADVARAEPTVSVDEYRGRGERILVVDDEVHQRKIATGFLEKLGYRPSAVDSGEAALDWLEHHTADLVVLDMILNRGISGRVTYEKILQTNPSQKAIIASGFAETEDVERTLEMGAGAVIHKPYTIEEIGVEIRRQLDR
jgi:CheY-like chemotaxis protein